MKRFFNLKKIKEHVYIGVKIIIYNAVKAAICCEEVRNPNFKSCPKCGKPLEHREVTIVLHKGKILLQLEKFTAKAAQRRAEEVLERMWKQKNPDNKKNRPPAPPKRKKPKKPNDNRGHGQRKKPKPVVPPIPPGFDMEDIFPAASKKGNQVVMADMIDQMEELGWGEKATRIWDETRGPKKPDEKA